MLTAIQQPFFVVVFILLGICMIACLIAAIRGPGAWYRIVAANMIWNIDNRHHLPSFLRIAAKLAIGCGVDLHHDSFLAVVVLTRIFIRRYKSRAKEQEKG